jgi:hypothetical protein
LLEIRGDKLLEELEHRESEAVLLLLLGVEGEEALVLDLDHLYEIVGDDLF